MVDIARDPQKEQGTPTQADVIARAIRKYSADLHTAMPGIVEEVNGDGSVDVQPFVMRKYFGEEAVKLPVVLSVPVIFPSTSNAWIKFPISKGDGVLLVFCERSLETWWLKGGVGEPNSSRRHDLTDAVAIPGLFDVSSQVKVNGATTSLEAQNGGSWLEITASGKVKLGNEAAEVLDILNQTLTMIKNLKTMDPVTGPEGIDPSTLAQVQNLQALLASLSRDRLPDMDLKQTSTGDLALDTSGNLTFVEGAEEVVQLITQRLRTYAGECYYNITLGVPYIQQVLVKNPVKAESVLKREIAETPGVQKILKFSLTFNQQRQGTCAFKVLTDNGPIPGSLTL